MELDTDVSSVLLAIYGPLIVKGMAIELKSSCSEHFVSFSLSFPPKLFLKVYFHIAVSASHLVIPNPASLNDSRPNNSSPRPVIVDLTGRAYVIAPKTHATKFSAKLARSLQSTVQITSQDLTIILYNLRLKLQI